PPPCGPTPPFLLVLVPSAPTHAAQRQAIRETWGGGIGRPNGFPTRLLFVLGVPSSRAQQATLRAEALRHGDLL
ncbi:B3GT4 galactosyltransferase, partial [Calonectris borealis]|nr:B3GT4 galactosyltransferase [Calonectris borealis]